MNYLAHIYLSGENDLLKIGNFMADSVRGKQYLNYPEPIKNGIILHRSIDSFTDFHPIYRKSKHRLHAKYGHYSGVIMDIFYDYFLANNWTQFHPVPLEVYANDFYDLLRNNESIITEKTRSMLPHMIENNWLVSYATKEGLEKILYMMDYRTKHRVAMYEAITELNEYYSEFESEFFEFFEELQNHCHLFIKSL
jgi:acyl carrier protein phosphodiesterase